MSGQDRITVLVGLGILNKSLKLSVTGYPLTKTRPDDDLAPARGVLRAAVYGTVLWAVVLVGCASVTGEYDRNGILLPPETFQGEPPNPAIEVTLPATAIIEQCGVNERTKLFSGATAFVYSRECVAVGLEYWQAQLFLVSRELWSENNAQIVSDAKKTGSALDIMFLPNDAPETEYEALRLHAFGHRNGWNSNHTN